MRKMLRAVVPAAVVAVTVPLLAVPASAAPPSNDTIAGATSATSGFSEVLDTSEATTDADDAALNAPCGAPATDASVWYAFSQAVTGGVVVDVSTSSYSAGVLVGVGSPGSLSIVACGPGTVGFLADAGTTYYVLAIDDQFDGGGNGGLLRISFGEAPPPPTVELTVDPVGYVTKAGTALLSGTYTCTNASFVNAFGSLTQPVGRFAIEGSFGFFAGGCDGTAQPWSAEVFPFSGKFAGGRSAAVTLSFACGAFECAFGYTEQQVFLRGLRR